MALTAKKYNLTANELQPIRDWVELLNDANGAFLPHLPQELVARRYLWRYIHRTQQPHIIHTLEYLLQLMTADDNVQRKDTPYLHELDVPLLREVSNSRITTYSFDIYSAQCALTRKLGTNRNYTYERECGKEFQIHQQVEQVLLFRGGGGLSRNSKTDS